MYTIIKNIRCILLHLYCSLKHNNIFVENIFVYIHLSISKSFCMIYTVEDLVCEVRKIIQKIMSVNVISFYNCMSSIATYFIKYCDYTCINLVSMRLLQGVQKYVFTRTKMTILFLTTFYGSVILII